MRRRPIDEEEENAPDPVEAAKAALDAMQEREAHIMQWNEAALRTPEPVITNTPTYPAPDKAAWSRCNQLLGEWAGVAWRLRSITALRLRLDDLMNVLEPALAVYEQTVTQPHVWDMAQLLNRAGQHMAAEQLLNSQEGVQATHVRLARELALNLVKMRLSQVCQCFTEIGNSTDSETCREEYKGILAWKGGQKARELACVVLAIFGEEPPPEPAPEPKPVFVENPGAAMPHGADLWPPIQWGRVAR